jgi:hypothetical protein
VTKAQAQIADAKKRRASPSVTGFIDAITDDRVFGWAWDPQRASTRLAIRIEVDGKPVATAVADQSREDLASNGVGDGAHAFEAILAQGIKPDKIGVFAVSPDTGESLELTHRPIDGEAPCAGQSDEFRGTVHAVVRSQRLLSGRVQSLVESVDKLRTDAAAKTGNESVASRLDVLEVAVARIDGILREQGLLIDGLKRRPHDQISRVLAGAAAALAGAACMLALWW